MNIQCDECIVVITRPKSLLSFFGCFIAVVEAIYTVCEQPALIVCHGLNLHEIIHFV